tara:strand:- start:194 stop:964 length:771 start_codon:yes stop_codon:yes gene_type:complete
MRKSPNTVYIGYDPREDVAYEVLKFTIERIAVDNVRVVPIRKDLVERMGIYNRKYDVVDGQSVDRIDGKPFSSDFSFTRFLVPALNMYEGWALYMDCDMYLRTDINELFEEYNMDYYPLYCVKHDYAPENKIKMDGRKQEHYRRKNWSSLILWNCGHQLNKTLTPLEVNTQTGGWLHGFEWLPDKEADIGTIHQEWNWLDGHSPEEIEAKNVHFTTGGPWFKEWKCTRAIDGRYAAEWNGDYTYLAGKGIIEPYDI